MKGVYMLVLVIVVCLQLVNSRHMGGNGKKTRTKFMSIEKKKTSYPTIDFSNRSSRKRRPSRGPIELQTTEARITNMLEELTTPRFLDSKHVHLKRENRWKTKH